MHCSPLGVAKVTKLLTLVNAGDQPQLAPQQLAMTLYFTVFEDIEELYDLANM